MAEPAEQSPQPAPEGVAGAQEAYERFLPDARRPAVAQLGPYSGGARLAYPNPAGGVEPGHEPGPGGARGAAAAPPPGGAAPGRWRGPGARRGGGAAAPPGARPRGGGGGGPPPRRGGGPPRPPPKPASGPCSCSATCWCSG